ncbi:conserved hypothetical protein [Pyrenophora tritici-repentis Pt-1C-BFP]|uniref:RING-type domain-containing protein n=1 Tax=Pyrenophora tritici-repentis (strain Pt-1C-BFP) TaxID=426418 RepID=B2WHR6_PYRTR|nr:uncharacterized protein PTRG_09525 [Pyrenophora tritici-repentis Pt-1C-BFP]EDU42576.1 conserved hypothetical protein [Pyrenophora tritici-repentis Pt-1C-BFP]
MKTVTLLTAALVPPVMALVTYSFYWWYIGRLVPLKERSIEPPKPPRYRFQTTSNNEDDASTCNKPNNTLFPLQPPTNAAQASSPLCSPSASLPTRASPTVPSPQVPPIDLSTFVVAMNGLPESIDQIDTSYLFLIKSLHMLQSNALDLNQEPGQSILRYMPNAPGGQGAQFLTYLDAYACLPESRRTETMEERVQLIHRLYDELPQISRRVFASTQGWDTNPYESTLLKMKLHVYSSRLIFHPLCEDCLETWIHAGQDNSHRCPMCRTELFAKPSYQHQPPSLEEDRENEDFGRAPGRWIDPERLAEQEVDREDQQFDEMLELWLHEARDVDTSLVWLQLEIELHHRVVSTGQ